MQVDLSVLIPALNEDMLDRTIQDVLENIQGKTEIIVVLDGYLPNPSLTVNDPRVTLIYNPEPKGQRGATNQAAKLAKGKYVMKSDAHVAFDKGFDIKMLEAFKKLDDNVTMIPILRNLHAYDWVCENNHRRYQGKKGVCPECGKSEKQDVVWIAKSSPSRFTFTFDREPHFQYWGELAKRPENIKGALCNDETYDTNLRETLTIQGSCFMLTKERYFALDICSEDFHSWGAQGIEVGCKTWLSGGRVIANLNTWYAHMFRTNNFGGFPYSNPESLIEENRELSRNLFIRNKWPKAIHSFEWLINKFNPPGWENYEPGKTRGIIYYTDNELTQQIAKPCQEQLKQISQEDRLPIVTASLHKKLDFGVKNIVFPSLKRGYYSMFKQILGALENSQSDIIFFTEADVLYHPSHFDFVPPEKDTFYYNQNVWYLRQDGHTLHYDVNQLSGLCVYRKTALIHFRERFERLQTEPFTRHTGFEPFTHNRVHWNNTFKLDTWISELPNVDIRFGVNATGMRWKKEEYRNQQLLINWQENENFQIPGWSDLQKLFSIPL